MNDRPSIQEYESVDGACLQELRDLTMFNDNPDRFLRLLKTFVDALDTQINLMREALKTNDAEGLTDLAHGLKGTAASMGARYLAFLCASLEQACGNADFGGVKAEFDEIEIESRVVGKIIEEQASA